MPVLNDVFKRALEDRNLAAKPNALAVLNDLIKINHSNPATALPLFRQAILAKPDFWNGLGGLDLALRQDVDDGFLIENGDIDGNGANPAHDFNALYQLATEKRMILALASVNEQTLQELIKEDNLATVRQKLVDNNGKTKVGSPPVTIPGWQANPAAVLPDLAVGRIKAEAERLLILKKIAACTNFNLIDALLAANNDVAFRAAADALGVNDPVPGTAAKMNHATLARVQTDAAKKGFELRLANEPTPDLNAMYQNLRRADPVAFVNTVTQPPYRAHLQAPDDATWVREVYGKKYLEEYYAQHNDVGELDGIAKEPDPTALKNLLREDANDNPYLNTVITEKNIPSLRQVAATQALKLKIAKLEDVATLDALAKASTPGDIKRILAGNAILGYRNDLAFHNAFIDSTSVKQIVAAASVRKAVYTATDTNLLKQMILNPDFNAGWRQLTAGKTQPAGVADYFKNPANQAQTTQQALVALAKLELKHLPADHLVAMALPNTTGILKGSVRVILGNDATTAIARADNLITDIDDGQFEKTLRAHAAIEIALRITKTIQLNRRDRDFPDFVKKINALSIKNPTTLSATDDDLDGTNVSRLRLNVGELIAILPDKDKEAFRARLVENLVLNYPDTKDSQPLQILAQAKDFASFKIALNTLGVTSQVWVDKETMEAVQRAASTRAIALSFANHTRFTNHTALMEVVGQLPLAKQQAILAKPEIMRSLMDAQTGEAIQAVLGSDVVLADATTIDRLANENHHHAFASKIINAKVAEIIGNMPLAQPLDDTKIQAINAIALGNDPFTAPNYKTTIDSIARVIGLNNDALDRQFGHNPDVPATKAAVLAQAQHNQHLVLSHNGQVAPVIPAATPDKQVILQFLMTLNKHHPVPDAQIDALVDAFRQSKTAAEFITKIQANGNLIHAPAVAADVFNLNDLQKQITPQAFADAKIKANKTRFLSSDQNLVEEELERQKAVRQPFIDLHKKITASDKKVHSQLKFLSETTAFDWLNPGFMASAKQNAREMLADYTELDQVCDEMLTFYENEKSLLKQQRASLPEVHELQRADKWRQDKIAKQRSELDKQLNAIDKELQRYQGVQKLLRGDPRVTTPLINQGILKSLEAAKKGADIKFSGFISSITDYPTEQKKSLLGTKGTDTLDVGHTNLISQTQSPHGYKTFNTEKPIPEGHLRNHTIGVQATDGRPIYGRFLEERGPDVARTNKHGKIEYSVSTTLTVRDAPQDLNGLPQGNSADASKKFYMALAMQALKALNGPPTKEKPLYLEGENAKQVEGIWMALMVIGHNDENMKFNSDAIAVTSSVFDPQKHISKWPLRRETITHPQYKDWQENPGVRLALRSMKEFAETKLGPEKIKAKEKTNEAAKGASQFYRGEFKDVRKEAEDKNKEVQATTPTLPGMKNS